MYICIHVQPNIFYVTLAIIGEDAALGITYCSDRHEQYYHWEANLHY